MRRSFFLKLLGAFVLVILILAVVVAVLVNEVTARQFRVYADRSGQLWAAQLAPQLADYYVQRGNWQDIETVLQTSHGMMGTGMWAMGDHMVSPGTGSTVDGLMPHSASEGGSGDVDAAVIDMWAMMGQRVVLADARGQVVSDSMGTMIGSLLPAAAMSAGAPVRVDGQVVGTVFVTPLAAPVAQSPAGAYLWEVNRAILVAVLVAGVIAMILGAGLFFQLTAPIRQLTVAANAIAAGDLSTRVPVRSDDELGELANAFNAMAANLASSEAQRRQIVADVAHELRTPLSVLQANLEAMQDGVLPTDTEQLASLHEETLLLSRLVTDLRLLSLAETGQLKLERMEVDLCELVRKACERMRPAAQAQGISLQQETPPAAPVRADTDRLYQVIGNLMDNALRHTPAGGAIMLHVGPADMDRASAPAPLVEGKFYLVTITDTGTGIPPEDLALVFDRFYRVDKSRTRASGGSGLGLAIAREIVEAHGGQIWAESPIYHTATGTGYGTRLSFALPALA